jgi:hypothetical protein
MGLWSAQRNDYTQKKSPLVELANTTNNVQGITKRGSIVQAPTASPCIWEALTLFLKGDVRFKDCAFFREVRTALSIHRNYNIKKYSTKRPDATQKEWHALRPT